MELLECDSWSFPFVKQIPNGTVHRWEVLITRDLGDIDQTDPEVESGRLWVYWRPDLQFYTANVSVKRLSANLNHSSYISPAERNL